MAAAAPDVCTIFQPVCGNCGYKVVISAARPRIGATIIEVLEPEDSGTRFAYASSATGVAHLVRFGYAFAEEMMDIDLPEIVAEVEKCFAAYEAALASNDVAGLTVMFSDLPQTIRYGIGENLYGAKEIHDFRAGRSPVGLSRRLSRTVISTYGRDFATASTLFHRNTGSDKIGRQMQSWVRMPQGWRIVAAHVSFIEQPA